MHWKSTYILLSAAVIGSAAEVRITNDSTATGGYISAYTQATGVAYTDPVLAECSLARGRQNEPSVAINPRDPRVIVASSNDYCGVYAGSPAAGPLVASGPIWLGYYRSSNSGATFASSLVPGYPGDVSPYAQLAHIRTASAGDPVIAWDNHGRVYFGAESSDDPAGSKKSFGDVWVATFDNPAGVAGATIHDGKRFLGSTIVASGSSAPNYGGKFHDKTAIEADRTGGACDGNVYFSWSRFTGYSSNIYFSRSTDHGASWSKPQLLTSNVMNVQDPDISVTGSGNVYVTFDQGSTVSGQADAVMIAKSADCGMTFSKPVTVTTFIPYTAQDVVAAQPVPAPASLPDDPKSEEGTSAAGSLARDCGDFDSACASGYTFFRRST
ncbi:MAG TPA: sialidase family protein, partial [Bryobacteraceae bacterium]|nr:sialidase family protein [Bryobacteraceae bacterium]